MQFVEGRDSFLAISLLLGSAEPTADSYLGQMDIQCLLDVEFPASVKLGSIKRGRVWGKQLITSPFPFLWLSSCALLHVAATLATTAHRVSLLGMGPADAFPSSWFVGIECHLFQQVEAAQSLHFMFVKLQILIDSPMCYTFK